MTDSSRPLVIALRGVSPTSANLDTLLGGKGAGLVRLIRGEFAVPDGFVVTTEAYRAVVRRQLQGLTDIEAIRARLLGLTFEEPLLGHLKAHFDRLVDEQPRRPLAVRSSASGEDGDIHSFAGQQASFLGVRGFEAMCDHIRQVWASLFDTSAAIYRSQVSLEAVPPAMAVVVQRMIDARSAGVCFTANPVNGAVTDLVISAASGLGVSVVGGDASDTFYIRRSDGRITGREIAEQSEAVILSDTGGTQSAPVEDGHTPTLTDAALNRVSTLALQIEDRFAAPQDIEWAFDPTGGLWVLQTRPITAVGGDQGARPSVWTNINVGEALPGVGTPMTWSVIRGFSRRGFEMAFGALGLDVPAEYELVGSFYGRVYLNLSQFASVITQIPVMSPKTLLRIAGGPAVDQIRGNYEEHSPQNFLLRLPLTVPKMVASQLGMPFVGRQWARYFRRQRDTFFKARQSRMSMAALEDRLAVVDRLFDWTGLVMLACSSNFLSSYVVAREMLVRWGGEPAAAREHRLFSGLSGLRSAEPGLELLGMARHIRAFPKLESYVRAAKPEALIKDLDALLGLPGGGELRRRFDTFLKEYGHRAPREAEIATPRWREDPTFVFEMLQTYLKAPYMPDPAQLEQERIEARQETTDAVRRHFTTGLGLIFRQALRLSHKNARLREDLRDCVVETLNMYRHVFLEVGQRLTARRVLREPSDVFFLTQREVRAYLAGDSPDEYPVRIALRRAEYEAFRAMPDPPETFTLLRGKLLSTEPEPSGNRDALVGLPGSAGRVTARARVIIDPNAPESVLHPGEILVAPLTDVGWTPLFLAASGVIMEKGGPLSHSCIVAREYGIPAVVDAKRATSLIATGDLITIDGDKGIVYLAKATS